ncbi:MAG: AAA family ATPase [Syntrophobacteraceae bacterium]|jgi:general secretion pathway protein A|nr:AAA family ATPase [Syntrophobacteraceae bacterium]
MEYFKTFNLQREPFSNSPDPDLFFESRMHQSCLQRLELSIRLRRGLNVVLGEVGTGKTTLCRRLIRGLAEDETIETHLILDPALPSALAFLQSLASMLGLPSSLENEDSEWRIKNAIQKHLFHKGIEEGRILVLLIDEGQKLSGSILEILRELLNYEANECKLLQIVVFAQTEFETVLLDHPSFADRISLCTRLGPLGLREARSMIRFRLHKASQGHPVPALFTPLGLLALHRATRGYPRKIIHLCHRVLLAMIIQNRTRAGWSLVTWAARMAFPPGTGGRSRPAWVLSTLVVMALTGFLAAQVLFRHGMKVSGEEGSRLAAGSTPSISSPTPSGPADAAGTAPAASGSHPEAPASGASPAHAGAGQTSSGTAEANPQLIRSREASAGKPPKILGQIAIAEGETLEILIRSVYGAFTPIHLKAVRRSNPQIRRVRNVEAGTSVRFPVVEAVPGETARGYWVAIFISSDLQEVYDLLRGLRGDGTPRGMRPFIQAPPSGQRGEGTGSPENQSRPTPPHPLIMVPFWNPSEGLAFALVLRAVFPDPASAAKAMGTLPPEWTREAAVLGPWEEGTVLFTEDLPIDGHRW